MAIVGGCSDLLSRRQHTKYYSWQLMVVLILKQSYPNEVKQHELIRVLVSFANAMRSTALKMYLNGTGFRAIAFIL